MSVLAIDGALVTRTQAGDEEATTELAGQVRPLAQRYASRFFSDPSRAEDLAQTAMMKAFARIGDVRSPEAFQAWLLRITRNECLNELARQRVAQVPISTLEDQGTTLVAPAGGEDDPEESFVRAQLQSLVRQVIATLPSHYRRTLTMRALEDAGYEEISAELDVPVAVARLWYCRARKRFRQAFVDAMVARRNVPAACMAMGGDIAELIEGTLVRSERDRVQGHLAECHVCRQTEDELRSTAFRTPARATLLGLGLLGLPRKLAQHAASTAHAAHWGARMALGAAGTATALVAVGVPAAGALAVSGAPAQSVTSGVAAAATRGHAGQAGALDGVSTGQAAQQAGWYSVDGSGGSLSGTGGVMLLGSVDGMVAAVEALGLGSLVHVHLPLALPATGSGLHHVVAPVVAAVTATPPGAVPGAAGQAQSGQSTSAAGQQTGASGAGATPSAPGAPSSAPTPGTPTAPPASLPGAPAPLVSIVPH